jgi:hypothetical protein
MEQTLPYLWNVFNNNVDWAIVLLVIASGYFQSTYLKDYKINPALKTLMVSFIVSIIYLLLAGDITNKAALVKYFFSFFLATSLYDILLKGWLKKLIVKEKNKLN